MVWYVDDPLIAYVPGLELTCASLNSLHGGGGSSREPSTTGSTEPSTSGSTDPRTGGSTEPSISGSSTCSPAPLITAQVIYPNYDPALFVLPDLPVSVSESSSVTLTESDEYSSQTQSLLSSFLGVSFSQKRLASSTFTLNAKHLRILSLNQHSKVFSKLMSAYGTEIKNELKCAGGTMYFVVGIRLATDATVEKCQRNQKSVAGNVMVDATQVIGLGTQGTSGIELGQISTGRAVQKESGGTTIQDIKGERAFALEYCCVKLRRKIDWAHMTCRRPVYYMEPFDPDRLAVFELDSDGRSKLPPRSEPLEDTIDDFDVSLELPPSSEPLRGIVGDFGDFEDGLESPSCSNPQSDVREGEDGEAEAEGGEGEHEGGEGEHEGGEGEDEYEDEIEPHMEGGVINSPTFPGYDDDDLEVVLDDEVFLETLDCLA